MRRGYLRAMRRAIMQQFGWWPVVAVIAALAVMALLSRSASPRARNAAGFVGATIAIGVLLLGGIAIPDYAPNR